MLVWAMIFSVFTLMPCSIGKLKSGKRRASETRAATLARSRTANGKLTPKRSTIPRTA